MAVLLALRRAICRSATNPTNAQADGQPVTVYSAKSD